MTQTKTKGKPISKKEIDKRKKEYVKYVESLQDKDLVTLVRYKIITDIAVIPKAELEQINKKAADSYDEDSCTSDMDKVYSLIDNFPWDNWHDYPFDEITDFYDFNVESDTGYIAFPGDVARFADDCFGMFNYPINWKCHRNLDLGGGILITNSEGQS